MWLDSKASYNQDRACEALLVDLQVARVSSFTEAAYDALRFWLLCALCLLRLYLLRPYLQAFLYTAVVAAELLLERSHRDLWPQLQRKVAC
jgi:hypothetical protein